MDSVDGFLGRLMVLAYSQAHHFVMSKTSYPFFFLIYSRSQSSMENIIPDLNNKHKKRSRIVYKMEKDNERKIKNK